MILFSQETESSSSGFLTEAKQAWFWSLKSPWERAYWSHRHNEVDITKMVSRWQLCDHHIIKLRPQTQGVEYDFVFS